MNLSHGRSGNISVRCGEGMLISPSGCAIGDLAPDDFVLVDAKGAPQGQRTPSSEWRIHRDIFAARLEFGAVVHTHSRAATALACLRRDIPAIHYMILMGGGSSIRCSDYATFGTQMLSDMAIAALVDRNACLLANHGVLAAGGTLEEAVRLAEEVENLAILYSAALAIGDPVVLTQGELDGAKQQFESLRYGQ
jgi:L-fuculose-phosphate aldolase